MRQQCISNTPETRLAREKTLWRVYTIAFVARPTVVHLFFMRAAACAR
jgi:hypothetical protein